MINKDELLDIVDENNNIIGQKPRKEVHGQGLWHRVSQIWVINSKNQILVQRRSLLKDTSPGKWEPFFGGHLNSGINYLEGALIEIKEELGLNVEEKNLKLWKIYKMNSAHEFQAIFIYIWDGDSSELKTEEEEIDQVKWMDFNEVFEFVLSGHDNNWSRMGYEAEFFKDIIGKGTGSV